MSFFARCRPYCVALFHGVMSGIAVTWCVAVLFRAAMDGHLGLVMGAAEWWLALGLLGSVLVITATVFITPPAPAAPNASWRDKMDARLGGVGLVLITLIGTLIGGGLVAAWQAQMLLHQLDRQPRTAPPLWGVIAQAFDMDHPVAIPQDPACQAQRQLWFHGIGPNSSWIMSATDKLWVEDHLLKAHAAGCWTDRELFEAVADLRYRPTASSSPSDTLLGYAPSSPQGLIAPSRAKEALSIHEQQWCVQQTWSALFQAHRIPLKAWSDDLPAIAAAQELCRHQYPDNKVLTQPLIFPPTLTAP